MIQRSRAALASDAVEFVHMLSDSPKTLFIRTRMKRRKRGVSSLVTYLT